MTSKEAELTMAVSPSAAVAISASGSQQAVVIKGRRYRQRPLGPAPFASFEDLSDELDSPPETARVPLPGIKEDPASQIPTPNASHSFVASISLTEKEDQGLKEALSSSLDTPAPPRIDISRASSSSQHEDSITSSPDRETGTQNLGYKEDGTVDLRSSTEELDYIQEPGTVEESEAKKKRERMMKKQQQLKQDYYDTQSEIDIKERKDSSCSVLSDTGLFCRNGRTSRLSSIGSVASGGSAASGVSHLSAGSHMSGRSTRSPSPHKMLLETSFCGSKPMHTQSIEAEAAPELVSHMEKQASRPPSRLCSRSPSPHKMLLETSFCGTKEIFAPEVIGETAAGKVQKHKVAGIAQTAPEVMSQRVQKIETRKPTEAIKENLMSSKSQIKVEESTTGKPVAEIIQKPRKAKPVSLPRIPDKKANYTKPKKIISIRDIPADEIYIPLKGPEVDLEEIIRKASPNLKRKVETKPSENVIFIPLHSPTESDADKDKKEGRVPFKQNFDNGIYIPLHSPPKSPKSIVTKKEKPLLETKKGGIRTKTKEEPQKHKYEICEDGSIFIPLHSPDEESRPIRTFEDEIKRVDEELRKAREMAEKKLQAEEKQHKPATLDIIDTGIHRQSLPPGKTEMGSGGSRTPSPGSTLSRKSSFASLFRRSDVTGSPDSSAGSSARKKSGTLSNIIKDAGDGLRDRSRSRSKNRERQSQSAVVRSPSVKKNVFTNLFGKKKTDEKAVSGKANSEASTRLNLQFSFGRETEKGKNSADEGDYIIIPLRDPSDPSPGEDDLLDEVIQSEKDNLPSPVVILERCESPSSLRRNKEDTSASGKVENQIPVTSSIDWANEVRQDNREKVEEVASKVEGVRLSSSSSMMKMKSHDEFIIVERHSTSRSELETCVRQEGRAIIRQKTPSPKEIEQDVVESFTQEALGLTDSNKKDLIKQPDSSGEVEEEPKEELIAVSTDGLRKLKLPPEPGDLGDDHERKELVLQESFDDELPYVPTTLPLERSVGVPIVPVKQRVAEIRTCPIERPRSTTPINPSTLEDYVNVRELVRVSAEEKMKISLPRDDSLSGKSKSPRRYSAKGKTWFEFAEAVAQSPRETRKSSLTTTPSPPPLPPRSSPPNSAGLSTSAPQATSSWINFEELPEKRKQPKRITTVPSIRSSADGEPIESESTEQERVTSLHLFWPQVVWCLTSPVPLLVGALSTATSAPKIVSVNVTITTHTVHDLTQRIVATLKGDIDKSVRNECKDCGSGRHVETEEDIEKAPLLECNSDGEYDDSGSRREWELVAPGSRLDVDGQSFLSDSSYECISQDTCSMGGFDNGTERPEMRPFEMDFDVKSNRSSLVSQEDLVSPEEMRGSLPL